jgi:hypothetical protein
MAVDGPFGPDTPEGGVRPRSADAPARTGTAEARDRAACYEALLKADEQQSGRQDHVAIRASRSAWDDGPTASHSDRLAPDSIELPPERAGHILDGDAWGGGHRHGTGRPGKTEFRPTGTMSGSSVTSWTWRVIPTPSRYGSRTTGGEFAASAMV